MKLLKGLRQTLLLIVLGSFILGGLPLVYAADNGAKAGKLLASNNSKRKAKSSNSNGQEGSESEDPSVQDPANVGMTMKAIQDEIAKIDAKGAEANEADKSSKSDFQAILEIDQQILNYKAKTQAITNVVGGVEVDGRDRYDEYSAENLAKFVKEMEKQHKNLKLLSLSNLLGIQGANTTFIEGAQKQQARMEGYVENINALPRDFQTKSSQLTDKIIANRNSLSGMAMGTENVSLRMRLEAEINCAQAELSFNQFIMQNSNVLYEKLRERIDDLKQAIETLSNIQNDVSAQIIIIKQTEVLGSEKSENNAILERAGDSVLIKALAQDNNKLIKRLSEGFQTTKTYNEENTKLLKLIERTRKVGSDIESQIKYFKNSVFLSQILFNQRFIIPDFSIPAGLSEEVGRLRMEIYSYGVEIEQVATPMVFLNEFVSTKGLPMASLDEFDLDGNKDSKNAKEAKEAKADKNEAARVSRDIARLLELREAILTRLYSETTVKVNSAVNVMINYDKYVKLKGNLNEQIYERMFWSPSNNSLFKRDWILKFPEEIQKQLNFINSSVAKLSWNKPPFAVMGFASIVGGLALVLLFLKGRMKKKVVEINGRLNSFVTDSQLNTPKVLLLIAGTTLWLPLFIFIFGGIALSCLDIPGQENIVTRVQESIFSLISWFCLCLWGRNFIMSVLGPSNQIAEKHFGLNIHAGVLKCIGRVLTVFCMVLVLCMWKVEEPQTLAVDIVGQLTLIGLSLYLFFEFALWEILLWKGNRAVGGIFINLIPLVLSGVIVVLTARGYYYSGACVTLHFIASFFVCIAYLIISSLIARSMKLSSRRINYKRWQESRKNASSSVKEEHVEHVSEIVDLAEKEMSTSEMSSQTMVIARYILLTLLCVVLYHIWSGLLSVTSYFEYISLYDIKAEDQSVIRSVSVMDLLFVLYGVVITYVFLRNMPGVLEVLIFNRFKKLATYGYSIVTLCNYICIGAFTVFCLSRLGISWAELQWMVAALSVGLGFGLQEIFANFISGIIILFERPIRIGDIITINDNSGVVSKIRIRATTIVNFDYKEYVVPNKEFITKPIVNWSLNDTTTRIVVQVGVGYGTDVEQARQALYRIADANEYTLKNPAPTVYFLSFGDSNLNFELRVYVKNISERNSCIDTLNTEIYNEFNRLGIEIAFNQLDVFIKNVNNGQEIKVADKGSQLPNNLVSTADAKIN